MSAIAEDTKDIAKPDNKALLEEQLQNVNFFNSKQPKQIRECKLNEEKEEKEEKQSTDKPSKPGQARKIKLYLIDPDRFVIQWSTPKKVGKPLPIHYDIVINNNPFKKVVTQSNKKQKTFKILVFNCDHNELYKIGIDTYNDMISGKQSTLYHIKTIIKPSVLTQLQSINGIITFKPPVYKSFANIKYELIDANDIKENTILSTDSLSFDINHLNIDDLQECEWRIRIKETKHGNCSFSPVIGYNCGPVKCAKFTAAKIFEGDVNKFKTKRIKYPKWEAPPKPDILQEIKRIEFVDKGSYLLVPSELDPVSNNNVLTVLCFSDTHTKHKSFRFDTFPSADIVLHAGDFTFDGNKYEVMQFEEWGEFIASLSVAEEKNQDIYDKYYGDDDEEEEEVKYNALSIEERKYKHLICIAGNHEMTFDLQWYNERGSNAKRYHKLIKPAVDAAQIKDIIISSKYWHYLQDSCIKLYGLTIHGSPWQPYYFNWAFQKSRGKQLNEKWKLIPNETDILITHGPPYCHGDKVSLDRVKLTGDNREYLGDEMLMNRIKEIKNIQYHIFGHVHAGTGCSIQNGMDTKFINAASLNEAYYPRDKPIVFYVECKENLKDS